MRLFLLRHGETVENASGVVQGHHPGTLSGLGRDQARLVAEALVSEPFLEILCSDLRRCVETAEPIIEGRNCPISYDPRLRERGYGIFEGRHGAEYLDHFRASGESWHLYRPPGGETMPEVVERVRPLLDEITARYSDPESGKTGGPSRGSGSVLLVTHGGIIRAFLAACSILPVEDLQGKAPPNASLSILALEGRSRIRLERYGDVQHLTR